MDNYVIFDFRHQSSDLLEHKVAKLKWNTNVYHYFESRNKSKGSEYFKQEYQDILTMRELSRVSLTILTVFAIQEPVARYTLGYTLL